MSKLTEKIKTIGKAWKNAIIRDEEFEPMYQDRLAVCSTCEYNVLHTCSLCGCPLVSKTRSRYVEEDGDVTECPIFKWKDSFHEDNSGNLVVIKANLPPNLQQYFTEDHISREDRIEFLRGKDE